MTSRTIHAFDDELAGFDAVATADAIAAGSLTPLEVTEAAIRRSEQVESEIAAIIVDDHERALDAARRLGRRGGLAGVPTYIKDMVDVAGLPTTWGSEAIAGGPDKKRTTGIAAQFEDMGMVLLGKSTLPEFGFVPSTEPVHRPATRNPWNLDRTVGGSSGGAAALVAAGVVPIAHAADGGGSIRIPAACCGLVGLKATRWRLLPHREEQMLPIAVTVDGVVSRTVRDTVRWFAEAEQRYRRRGMPRIALVERPPARRLRVGAFIDLPDGLPVDAPIDDATLTTFDETASLLESLGHAVVPIAAPVDASFGDDFVSYWQLLAFLATKTAPLTHGRHVRGELFVDFTKGLVDGFQRDRGRVVPAIRRLRRTPDVMADLFRDVDVLLSPVTTTVAPPLGQMAGSVGHDDMLPRLIGWMPFTPLANAAGTPAISLPLGHDVETNLPVGMMLSAAHGNDGLLLELALELEAARPWRTVAGATVS